MVITEKNVLLWPLTSEVSVAVQTLQKQKGASTLHQHWASSLCRHQNPRRQGWLGAARCGGGSWRHPDTRSQQSQQELWTLRLLSSLYLWHFRKVNFTSLGVRLGERAFYFYLLYLLLLCGHAWRGQWSTFEVGPLLPLWDWIQVIGFAQEHFNPLLFYGEQNTLVPECPAQGLQSLSSPKYTQA